MAPHELQGPVPLISRERSPVAVLADRHSIDMGERDIRVDDYLNDKLQTASDFANLDSLIASIETQRIQLQDQVGSPLLFDPSGCYRSRRSALTAHVSLLSG
jgi:hypothetical protein